MLAESKPPEDQEYEYPSAVFQNENWVPLIEEMNCLQLPAECMWEREPTIRGKLIRIGENLP